MVVDASKPGISLAFVGSNGCGKTSAVARLCRLQCGFEESALAECKELSRELGNPQGECAWMLDNSVVERERGSTLEPSLVTFESTSFRYTAVDTRGHQNLKGALPAMSMADVAVLIVSAAEGEYENDISSGRTRDLAVSCFNMGIKNMVCAVTKMDSVTFNGDRFEDIKKGMLALLKDAGYKSKEPPVVPISGLTGGNLIAICPEMMWYTGTSLIDTLDAEGPINRPAEKPLRFPVLKVHTMPSGDTVIVGRVETGSLRPGVSVGFSPSGQVAVVQSIQLPGGQDLSNAGVGDVVTVAIDGDDLGILPGMVAGAVGQSEDPCADVDWFQAQVKVLDHPGMIRAGYCPSIAVGTAQVPCEFEELQSKLDPKTGKEAESNPESAKTGDIIMVLMRPRAPVCMEMFSAYPPLGRFAVRDHGRTVAIGVVKKIEKKPITKARGSENQYFDR